MVTGVRVSPGGGGGGVPPLSEQARTSAAAAAARARGRRIMVVFYCRFPSEVRMASLNVPMYDPAMVRPMREELTRIGFSELHTAAEVDSALPDERAPMLVVVNSVCGCAARNARPAATLALEHPVRPTKLRSEEHTSELQSRLH